MTPAGIAATARDLSRATASARIAASTTLPHL